MSCLMLASSLQILLALASAGTPPARLHALAHGAFNAGVNAHSIMSSSQRSSSNHLFALEESIMKQSGLYLAEQECDAEDFVLPDTHRKRALAANDPIATATPKSVLSQCVQCLQTALPPEVGQAIIEGVDPDILRQAIAITQQP
jgi:hypothetical protein